jgi:hypothetical protein
MVPNHRAQIFGVLKLFEATAIYSLLRHMTAARLQMVGCQITQYGAPPPVY